MSCAPHLFAIEDCDTLQIFENADDLAAFMASAGWLHSYGLMISSDAPLYLFQNIDRWVEAIKAWFPETATVKLAAALALDNFREQYGIYESHDYYKSWLAAADDSLECAIVRLDCHIPAIPCLRPPNGPGETYSKVDFLAHVADIAPPSPLRIGAAFAATGALYRAGRLEEAMAFLQCQSARQRHFLYEQALAVLTHAIHGKQIPPHLEDVYGDSDYFKDRFCTLPFYEMTIGVDGRAFICCPSYLNLSVGNIFNKNVDNIINSEQAIKIRRSILDGSFKYCNRIACSFIAGNSLPTREAVARPVFRKAIDEDCAELDMVHRMSLALDRSCNLSCPSCRTEVIIEKGEKVAKMMQATRDVILPTLKQIKIMQMSGYGEFAMSEPCRLILEKINPTEYPDLKLDLITNGLLFDKGFWQKYPNAHSMIRTVRVSIDGAVKDTYEKLRRGGNFNQLEQNMEFLASLRRQEMFEQFSILWVYQRDNFREMKAIVEWAVRLGCDYIYFEKLLDWNSYGDSNGYTERAVHLVNHPDYAEFRAIVSDPIFQHPIVKRDWIDIDMDRARIAGN